MNDCLNAEIRDQLPGLLHGRLDEAARTVVDAHVAACVDCHEELELLRAVLGMVEARTPNLDLAAIVRALPAPPKSVVVIEQLAHDRTVQPALVGASVNRNVVPIATRRRVWSDWRVAAAVTLLVAGGSSAMLLKRTPAAASPTLDSSVASVVAVTAPTANNSSDSSPTVSRAAAGRSIDAAATTTTATTPSTVAEADDRANTDLGNGNRLGDLNDQQLQALLNKIDNLPAVPVTEPEPVSLHVNSQSSSGGA